MKALLHQRSCATSYCAWEAGSLLFLLLLMPHHQHDQTAFMSCGHLCLSLYACVCLQVHSLVFVCACVCFVVGVLLLNANIMLPMSYNFICSGRQCVYWPELMHPSMCACMYVCICVGAAHACGHLSEICIGCYKFRRCVSCFVGIWKLSCKSQLIIAGCCLLLLLVGLNANVIHLCIYISNLSLVGS